MRHRRYIAMEFIGDKPTKEEIINALKEILGIAGFVRARIKFIGDFLSCDRKWVYKVRGALSMKYQFKVLGISGTLKGLRERIKRQRNC